MISFDFTVAISPSGITAPRCTPISLASENEDAPDLHEAERCPAECLWHNEPQFHDGNERWLVAR
ncbi:hypothetical protein DKG79_25290 (plasmid) [Escherichia fergusonii]|nr:hypothetical protein DKG79_25290 [Escherichia fergusonii]